MNNTNEVSILKKEIEDLKKDLELTKKLKESSEIFFEKYRNIFHHSPLGIFHYDINSVITDCNQYFVDILGSSRDQLVGFNMLSDLKNEGLKNTVRQSFEKGENIYEGWYTSVTGDKTTFVRVLFKCIINDNNEVISGIGLVEDITERKLAEQKLKENQLFIERITEQTPDIIYIYDVKKGKNIYINKNLRKLLGYKKSEVPEDSIKLIDKLIHPDDKAKFDSYELIVKKWDKEYVKEFEYRLKDANGNWRWFYGREKEFQRLNKQLISIIGVANDITERKEIQHKIFNTIIETEEKERQRLASDIHDEIGPLLSSLKVYIELLNQSQDESKQAYIKNQLQKLIKEVITNVREVSNAISPYLLNKYGLNIAVKSFLGNAENIINSTFKSNMKDERFPFKIETVYYRIIKELFNNTIKHANAKSISIKLNYNEDKLVLIYEDDGMGLDQKFLFDLKSSGMGMHNIINRIKSINGKYKFCENLKKGFKFELISEIEKLNN